MIAATPRRQRGATAAGPAMPGMRPGPPQREEEGRCSALAEVRDSVAPSASGKWKRSLSVWTVCNFFADDSPFFTGGALLNANAVIVLRLGLVGRYEGRDSRRVRVLTVSTVLIERRLPRRKTQECCVINGATFHPPTKEERSSI